MDASGSFMGSARRELGVVRYWVAREAAATSACGLVMWAGHPPAACFFASSRFFLQS
jgi:hypothetical protein